MNCHYCTYPIEVDAPYVPIAVTADDLDLLRHRYAHLACAIANVNTIQGHPDKSGKWCSYYHQPNGKWCMLPPHADDIRHELEGERDEKAESPTGGNADKRN